jgi:hypothetical protein
MWFTVVFPTLMFVTFLITADHAFYLFDPPRAPGMFMGMFVHFSRVFWAIFIGGISGAIGALGWTRNGQVAAPMLLAAAIYALLFNAITPLYYESFIHSNGRNYSKLRHTTVLTLGFSAVILFILGLVIGFAEI